MAMLIPLGLVNLTTAQRDALVNPQAGWNIYNTTTGSQETYNGTAWTQDSIETFLGLTDTASGYGNEGRLMVVNPIGSGLMPQQLERVLSGTYVNSVVFNHSLELGARYYWQFGEDDHPFKCGVVDNDIGAMTSTAPTYTLTSVPSILEVDEGKGGATTFGARSDIYHAPSGDLSDVGEDVTIMFTLALPLSQLAEDFTDRTILSLGSAGKIILRNGNLGYKQTSSHFHPTDLTEDYAHTIALTRDGTTGEIKILLNDVEHVVVGDTNTTVFDSCAVMSNADFTGYTLGTMQSLVVFPRILNTNELSDAHRVRRNLPKLSTLPSEKALGDLTDVAAYVPSDAKKSLRVNAAGNGTEYVENIEVTRTIEDGLRGYLAGAVPSSSICAMQIMNKPLTLPTLGNKSKIYALTAPVNAITFNVIKRALGAYETDIVIGTIDFTAGNANGVLTLTGNITFITGDMLCVESPALVEGTRDLFINLVGYGLIPFYA